MIINIAVVLVKVISKAIKLTIKINIHIQFFLTNLYDKINVFTKSKKTLKYIGLKNVEIALPFAPEYLYIPFAFKLTPAIY